MFIRFGAPRQIGDPEVLAERDPRDLVAGDFDGDSVPDLAIVNAGSITGALHIVLGRAAPEPPLGEVITWGISAGMDKCGVADFDRDGLPDLVLFPDGSFAAGQQPQLLLSRSQPGLPSFAAELEVPVRSYAYEQFALTDLDGDGFIDVVVASGGLDLRVDVAFGNGSGGFSSSTQLDVEVPGYTPDGESPLVGLHMVQHTGVRSLAMVMMGLQQTLPPLSPTPPVVFVLTQPQPRTLQQPLPTNVLTAVEPLGASLVANVDRDAAGIDEMVVAASGDNTTFQLGLLTFNGDRFEVLGGGVQADGEVLQSISSLFFGEAFPQSSGGPEVDGIFVVHESEIDGARERRLSTMLVFNNPLALLSPDLGFPESRGVRGLVGGSFTQTTLAQQTTLDLALAVEDEIRVRANDGFGGSFSPGPTMQAQRFLPETMTRVPAVSGGVDWLAFFTRDGKVGLWGPDSGSVAPNYLTNDLRVYASESALHSLDLSDRSRIRAADIDGDGVLDLVALLIFDLSNHVEGTGLLMALRGNAAAAPGSFPFFEPTQQADVTKVHGNSSSFTLADFVPEGFGDDTRLELALAVPVGSAPGLADGDHIRFYRLIQGAGEPFDRWQRSYSTGGPQVLLAGNGPTLVASTDFDTNGTVDLLVTAAGDSSIRLFLNNGQPGSSPGTVPVEAFVESFSSPQATAPGAHRFLNLGDINGDGNVDVLLTTEEQFATSQRDTSVGFYLSSGTGELVGPVFTSQERIGNRGVAASVDLGDFNGDSVPDLPVAWNELPQGARNVIVLFGGSR